MTNTAETLQTLQKFKTELEEKTGNEWITFNVDDIDIQKDAMYLKELPFSPKGTKKVLSHLRVKNNFLALSETMTSTDWSNVKAALKNATGEQVVYGRKIANGTEHLLDDIYMVAPKASQALTVSSIFDEIIDSIVSTGKDISLKSVFYLEDKDEVVVTLIENDQVLDLFKDGTEKWKIGKRIVWNSVTFNIFAYYERVECGSGVTVPKHGFRCNISNNKFNRDKITQALEKEITLESQDLDFYLLDNSANLNGYNISVREYAKYKNLFNENLHPEILRKWFDESEINKAYKCMATDMPEIWKITADSGINAFDFFKQLIYIASHPEDATPEGKEDVKLTLREKYDLELKAYELLFKRDLDMEMIAPKIKWVKETA